MELAEQGKRVKLRETADSPLGELEEQLILHLIQCVRFQLVKRAGGIEVKLGVTFRMLKRSRQALHGRRGAPSELRQGREDGLHPVGICKVLLRHGALDRLAHLPHNLRREGVCRQRISIFNRGTRGLLQGDASPTEFHRCIGADAFVVAQELVRKVRDGSLSVFEPGAAPRRGRGAAATLQLQAVARGQRRACQGQRETDERSGPHWP
mmetsp:Transcript_8429/g.24766  ORF Transcript_8429/g.24766 Transcript_8429/m.24766 type:complete len:209 (+) Transcript_8429:333-959(+)